MTSPIQERAQAVAAQEDAIRAIKSNVSSINVGEQLNSDNPDISGEVTNIRYKDLVSMWHRETGIQSYALPYMVPEFAKQRLPGGLSTFVFREEDLADSVRYKPEIEGHLCYLNPKHPDSARYHAMGYPKCISKPRPSMAVLESHMAKSHKPAWATIQKERDDALVEEDRTFQRKQTEALQALVERLARGQVIPDEEIQQAAAAALSTGTLEPVIDMTEVAEDDMTEAAEDIPDDSQDSSYSVTCEKCDFSTEGRRMAGAVASLRAHQKREHPTTE